jgi:hypothetical protein
MFAAEDSNSRLETVNVSGASRKGPRSGAARAPSRSAAASRISTSAA